MKSSISATKSQNLLEAIKSCEVVEGRVQLLQELDELDINEKSAVNSLIQTLAIYWEDFTCLDISQCTLNKTILQVAAKYLETDISGCLVQFLVLGSKVSTLFPCSQIVTWNCGLSETSKSIHKSLWFELMNDMQ